MNKTANKTANKTDNPTINFTIFYDLKGVVSHHFVSANKREEINIIAQRSNNSFTLMAMRQGFFNHVQLTSTLTFVTLDHL